MPVQKLDVAQDHVAKLTALMRSTQGIEELIWNSLDADASHITVAFERNAFDLVSIKVRDDGSGMDPAVRPASFGNLGGSWKQKQSRTPGHRKVHGKEGRGRFRAFGIGQRVEWGTRFKDNAGRVLEWNVVGDASDLCSLTYSDPHVMAVDTATGTTVSITGIGVTDASLTSNRARNELLTRFAIYLKAYPNIRIVYDDLALDVDSAVTLIREYPVETGGEGERSASGTLRIIEWNLEVERKLHVCNLDGFSRHEEAPEIRAKGFNFTAYLMTDLVSDMTDGAVEIIGLNGNVHALIDEARRCLREHFKAREVDRHREIVRGWKADGIYPYPEEAAASPLGKVEREVFDICAISVHERLSSFEAAEPDSKKLTFRLLKQALETSPGSLQTILREVLDLPKTQQDDLADLLQKTKLSAIIRAAKVVSDRLSFILLCKHLIFEAAPRGLLRERAQLHRVLGNELWLFGEKYAMGLDDPSLKATLLANISILGRQFLVQEPRSVADEGRIPDGMIFRKYPGRDEGEYEHLVIEIKAPRNKVGTEDLAKFRRFAFAAVRDPGFPRERTRWTFILVGTHFDEDAEEETRQKSQKPGQIHRGDMLEVYALPWNLVLQESEWRHQFYQQQLEIQIQEPDAIKWLEKFHPQITETSSSTDPSARPRVRHRNTNRKRPVLVPEQLSLDAPLKAASNGSNANGTADDAVEGQFQDEDEPASAEGPDTNGSSSIGDEA